MPTVSFLVSRTNPLESSRTLVFSWTSCPFHQQSVSVVSSHPDLTQICSLPSALCRSPGNHRLLPGSLHSLLSGHLLQALSHSNQCLPRALDFIILCLKPTSPPVSLRVKGKEVLPQPVLSLAYHSAPPLTSFQPFLSPHCNLNTLSCSCLRASELAVPQPGPLFKPTTFCRPVFTCHLLSEKFLDPSTGLTVTASISAVLGLFLA